MSKAKILAGRSAIVTGSSQGLGLAIAVEYAKEGANVLLCARDGSTLEKASQQVSESAAEGVIVDAQAADVSKPEDAASLAARAIETFGGLDILVNNAGLYGPMGAIEDVDWEDWTRAIEVNLLGSILMCRAVLPHFKRRGYGKIVQISGGGATNPLPRISAYAASKAAIVRFAESLAEEVREAHIDVNSIAPGALNTRLLDQVLAAGPERVGPAFYARSLKQRDEGGAPLDAGARLAVFLASAASDGITGKLISAVWDPWQNFGKHAKELRETDIYTLRRIVPKDRGMSWGDR